MFILRTVRYYRQKLTVARLRRPAFVALQKTHACSPSVIGSGEQCANRQSCTLVASGGVSSSRHGRLSSALTCTCEARQILNVVLIQT